PNGRQAASRPRLLLLQGRAGPPGDAGVLRQRPRSGSSFNGLQRGDHNVQARDAVINFSTYLPSKSASRSTASPTLRSLKAVISYVWGMIQMRKLFLFTAATVRLIPSTAMEPLGTT